MEDQKLAYHLAMTTYLYLSEIRDLFDFQEHIYTFFTEKYSISKKDKNFPWDKYILDLNKRLLGDNNNQLFKSTIVFCFSIFEAFNKDFFKWLYILRPEHMKTKNKVDRSYEELLNFNTREEMIEDFAIKKVDKFGRKGIEYLANELNAIHNFEIAKDFERWDSLREKYYARNLIVHNQGLISKDFIKKFPKFNEINIKTRSSTVEFTIEAIDNA